MQEEKTLENITASVNKENALVLSAEDDVLLKLSIRGWGEDSTSEEDEAFLIGNIRFDKKDSKLEVQMADHHIYMKRKVDGIWHRNKIADVLTRTYIIDGHDDNIPTIVRWVKHWRQ